MRLIMLNPIFKFIQVLFVVSGLMTLAGCKMETTLSTKDSFSSSQWIDLR